MVLFINLYLARKTKTIPRLNGKSAPKYFLIMLDGINILREIIQKN